MPYWREERTGHQEGNWVCTHLGRLFLPSDTAVMGTFLLWCPRWHGPAAAHPAAGAAGSPGCPEAPWPLLCCLERWTAQSSAGLQLLPETETLLWVFLWLLFPCAVIQPSSKEQEKLDWLLSVESVLLPAGHWEVGLEILFAEVLY